MKEYLAILIFIIIYILIIGRRLFKIPIWTSMLIGALLMVSLQIISIEDAFRSINLDVIAFLFGMFSIVSALDIAGVLKMLAHKMLRLAKTPSRILMVFVVGMGILSAFLVNDTIALLGVPLVIYISERIGLKPTPFLISLAFGVTVGSVMTPIGNPQNLLVAIQSGIDTPFITFLAKLGIPTIINLFLTYTILHMYYKRDILTNSIIDYSERFDYDPRLAKLSILVMSITIVGFIVSDILHLLHVVTLNLSVIAIFGATIIYAFSSRRQEIVKKVDYTILIFFAAMFIVTQAMWSSGAIHLLFMRFIPQPDPNDPIQSITTISLVSIALSQVLSNVPFISIYSLVMRENGFTAHHVDQWIMLAASSTVAGNLTILGAASNVIIIEAAESRGIRAFTFLEFLKIGSLVTLINILIYYIFIIYF